MCLIGLPVWYVADDHLFKQNQIVFGYSSECDYPDDGGVVCPKNYFWIINSLGRTVYVAVAAFLVLPLTLRASNWLAWVNKTVAYAFYTFYFGRDRNAAQDRRPMIADGNVNTLTEV